MTPQEVYVMVDDIKAFVRDSYRPTCCNLMPEPFDGFLCSACGEYVNIACACDGEDCHANYYPNCGAKVVDE